MKKFNILYYISAHGFGHTARSGQVIRKLIKTHRVIIKTMAPSWLLTKVMGKTLPVFPVEIDIGCIQKNNFDVDVEKTFAAYQEISLNNKQKLESELAFLKKHRIDLIISDSGSFPFSLAKKASLPSVFIGNFTWKGIYEHYLKDPHHPIIKELEEEYNQASYALITPIAMKMPELRQKTLINFIARKGKNIRPLLKKRYHIPAENKLVFHYAGNQGVENLVPELISRIDGYTILSYYPLPSPVHNFICLENTRYKHEDITASADLTMIKPGYGMVSEAIVNQVPIIYPPREDFAEYQAFIREFKTSGGTGKIRKKDFDTGNWGESLNRALNYSYFREYAATGAEESKKFIDAILK